MKREETIKHSSRRKWFLEMESPPGEAAVKIAKITTRDVEYHNLVDKAAAGV